MDFDLISDLHIDFWPDNKVPDFYGLGTSLNCVVAGDVSQVPTLTRDFLYQLADSYNHVVFVDGNHEHKGNYHQIEANCEWYERELDRKSNITYLWDSTCVIGTTAFVGSNGWWTFDYLEPAMSRFMQMEEFCQFENLPPSVAVDIWDYATENVEFLTEVVGQLSQTKMVENMVMVTHTLPRKDILQFPPTWHPVWLSKLTNSAMADVLVADTEKKIKAWCFGHHHGHEVDKEIDGIRYVSNPRGRPNDACMPVYYPKLITL